jgi:hypothetical protein
VQAAVAVDFQSLAGHERGFLVHNDKLARESGGENVSVFYDIYQGFAVPAISILEFDFLGAHRQQPDSLFVFELGNVVQRVA